MKIMSKKILFTDLDDTLFQSMKKCPNSDELLPVAYLKDGTAHSFQTFEQANLLKSFMNDMIVIPVTARNIDAYKRVKIGFKHGAIVNFGGTILDPSGNVVQAWRELVETRCLEFAQTLYGVSKWTADQANLLAVNLHIRVIADNDCSFYVSIKSNEGNEKDVNIIEPVLRNHLKSTELSVYRNGNNLVAMPNWLDKRHAVEFMKSQLKNMYGSIVTIGMGDSLSDLGFMKACDYVLAPSTSQVMQTLKVM